MAYQLFLLLQAEVGGRSGCRGQRGGGAWAQRCCHVARPCRCTRWAWALASAAAVLPPPPRRCKLAGSPARCVVAPAHPPALLCAVRCPARCWCWAWRPATWQLPGRRACPCLGRLQLACTPPPVCGTWASSWRPCRQVGACMRGAAGKRTCVPWAAGLPGLRNEFCTSPVSCDAWPASRAWPAHVPHPCPHAWPRRCRTRSCSTASATATPPSPGRCSPSPTPWPPRPSWTSCCASRTCGSSTASCSRCAQPAAARPPAGRQAAVGQSLLFRRPAACLRLPVAWPAAWPLGRLPARLALTLPIECPAPSPPPPDPPPLPATGTQGRPKPGAVPARHQPRQVPVPHPVPRPPLLGGGGQRGAHPAHQAAAGLYGGAAGRCRHIVACTLHPAACTMSPAGLYGGAAGKPPPPPCPALVTSCTPASSELVVGSGSPRRCACSRAGAAATFIPQPSISCVHAPAHPSCPSNLRSRSSPGSSASASRWCSRASRGMARA